jgi:hypothetical protein
MRVLKEMSYMPIAEDILMEAPTTDEVVDRDELASLAYWHWEMRGFPEDKPEVDWFWAEEELRRLRLAAGYEPEEA